MKIKLAGFNVDAEELGRAVEHVDLHVTGAPVFTPETISAAYARISRDPRSVSELRAESIGDVAKARTSNENIVFGLGHASVAEHAVFNFDMMGVSRLAIEDIEHTRLASFTEKSQRYIRLGDDFVLPREIAEVGLGGRFRAYVEEQNAFYRRLLEGIRGHLLSALPNSTKEDRKAADGRAKEDARYVTCLAVEGQLGMTCNARSLENTIRRLLCHPLHEVKSIGAALYSEAKGIAPSLLRYIEPSQEQLEAVRDLRALAIHVGSREASCEPVHDVKLLDWTEDADSVVMASLLHEHTGIGLEACQRLWRLMEPEEGSRLCRAVFGSLRQWDAVPRAFELARFRFELVVSASCFAQLKRHRMATILPQPYDVALGSTMPPTIREAGLQHVFEEAMAASQAMHGILSGAGLPFAAPYALTQAHRRRVVVEMNARELYHFSRMRQDSHAQWDIRAKADRMVAMAKRMCPLTMSLACGKDAFEQTKAKAIGGLA
jgi:thymidylate synthase ThyX